MKSGSVIPTSDSWVIKARSQATESTLFRMPGDSGSGSLGTELLGWYAFSWRWGRDAGWRGDAEDRNRSSSAPRHPPHGSPPGWECQQRLRNQWPQGQLYLRFALGQNCKRGKGNCHWVKVSPSGWRSQGYCRRNEQAEHQARCAGEGKQRCWSMREPSQRGPSIWDSGPACGSVLNLHDLRLSAKAIPSF